MAYASVQRVIVRMLYDPAFRQTVYGAPHTALAGLELTPEERDALVRPDPRAFGTDPFRRSRTLHGLLEEYPVSAWLAGQALGDVRQLDRFFASPFFHDCIQGRGSLAQAFGEYLDRGSRSGEIREPRVAWTAALEGAIALLRRRAAPAADATADPIEDGTLLVLSPRHAILTVAGGTGHLYQHVREYLAGAGEDLVATLLAPDATPPAAPFDALHVDDAEVLLLEQAPEPGGEITIEAAHSGLAALLAMAAQGASARALWGEAVHHGATDTEAREIVAELVAGGLLVLPPG